MIRIRVTGLSSIFFFFFLPLVNHWNLGKQTTPQKHTLPNTDNLALEVGRDMLVVVDRSGGLKEAFCPRAPERGGRSSAHSHTHVPPAAAAATRLLFFLPVFTHPPYIPIILLCFVVNYSIYPGILCSSGEVVGIRLIPPAAAATRLLPFFLPIVSSPCFHSFVYSY